MTTIENEIVNLVDDIIADYDKGRSIDKILLVNLIKRLLLIL